MTKPIRYAALALLAGVLGACATQEAAKAPPAAAAAPAPSGPAQTTPAAPVKTAKELEIEAAQQKRDQMLNQTTVYFAFDSNSIDDQTRAIIEAHASFLRENADVKMTLEGHCDERGTREYNLALGERRAKAVEKVMRALGVTAGQLKTVSYGEEKPVDPEHDETAWRRNRRVEIVY